MLQPYSKNNELSVLSALATYSLLSTVMDTAITILDSANVMFLEEFIVRFRETGIADKCVKYIGGLVRLGAEWIHTLADFLMSHFRHNQSLKKLIFKLI